MFRAPVSVRLAMLTYDIEHVDHKPWPLGPAQQAYDAAPALYSSNGGMSSIGWAAPPHECVPPAPVPPSSVSGPVPADHEGKRKLVCTATPASSWAAPPPAYAEVVTGAPRMSLSTSSGAFLPVVVPQAAVQMGQDAFAFAFTRCYAPAALDARGIGQAEFLAFVDGLNAAFLGSAALQALSLAGTATSLVPLHIPQIVGSILSNSAGLGRAVNSIVRTRAYLQRANAELFAPRGLAARVQLTKDMLYSIGVPPGAEADGLFALSDDEPVVWDADATPAVATTSMTGTSDVLLRALRRRMAALNGRVAPLVLDIPGPNAASQGMLSRLNARASERTQSKNAAKVEKRARSAAEQEAKAQQEHVKEQVKVDQAQCKLEAYRAKHPGLQAAESKALRKLERDVEHEKREQQKKAAKALKSVDRKRQRGTRKDHKSTQKLRWIVITLGQPADGESLVSEDSSRT